MKTLEITTLNSKTLKAKFAKVLGYTPFVMGKGSERVIFSDYSVEAMNGMLALNIVTDYKVTIQVTKRTGSYNDMQSWKASNSDKCITVWLQGK